MSWTLTDGVLAGLLLLSLLLGVWRGLVHELMALAGWAVAYFLAQWQAPTLATDLPIWRDAMPPVRYALAFVLIAVGTIFVWAWLSWLVRKLVDTVGLRPADRTLGAVFGVLRGVLVLLMLTALVQLLGWQKAPWWKDSAWGPLLNGVLLAVRPALPQALQTYLP